jgi:hypothetical protein
LKNAALPTLAGKSATNFTNFHELVSSWLKKFVLIRVIRGKRWIANSLSVIRVGPGVAEGVAEQRGRGQNCNGRSGDDDGGDHRFRRGRCK